MARTYAFSACVCVCVVLYE